MNKTKILYTDSEKSYAQKLLSDLIEADHCVKFTDSIKDTLIEYSFTKADLIICDIDLKDGSGLNLIKKLKAQSSGIKSILLLNSAEQDTLLEAISLKIDKVIFKDQPFEHINKFINELIVKEDNKDEIDSLIYNLGEDHYYEEDTFRIIKGEEIIQLTNQENLLIKELLKAKGELISFDILLNVISKDQYSTIDTLRTVIRKIRKKTYQNIILNQSGIGYKINFQPDIDIQSKHMLDEKIDLNVKALIIKGNKRKNDKIGFYLEKFGIKCENAYTKANAKELLEMEKYDYLICELDLPDGDGVDFIRETKELNGTKIIILSSSRDIHYKEYLYFKGILDYIIDSRDLKNLAYDIYKTIMKIETNTKYNNILVIEQSKKICEQVKDLLKPRNYNVNIINDIKQAYELLKTKEYPLVVIDIDFAGCFELIADVKSNIDKVIQFIILTESNRTYETVRDAYKNGAMECLRKPIFAEEFILKVDQIIEHSKLISEINEQKKLMESYKRIVDESTIFSKTDPNGIITYANSIFCSLSGYTKEELIGKKHNIVRHPSMEDGVFHDMWKTIKKEKKMWTGIIKNKAKCGKDYIVQTHIMPILDSEDTIIEFISLRSDITNLYNE